MLNERTADDIIRDIENEIVERARDDFHVRMHHICTKIISPIERIFAAALINEQDSWFDPYTPPGFFFVGSMDAWPVMPDVPGIFCSPQAQVDKYRADFLFAVHSPRGKKFLVVECDGHSYHERTKEQAAHDRSRDRWMTGKGITVLRFTGSEIWRDPMGSAEQVMQMLMAFWRDGS